MITYDLRIKFDPLVFALKRKADASLVDKLRSDLSSVMTTLGAQTTQLDMMKRMVDGGASSSSTSGDGSSGGGGGGGGGNSALLMEMAASIGSLSTELKALREQRASDAAHIEELQRSTGIGGGLDGYSISDQLTDRISALEANIASVLKKVSRELSRNSSATPLTPTVTDTTVDSPVASPPLNVTKGYDYGSEIRKLADRLESLVAEVVPVGSLAREALELAKSATRSAEAATQRANSAESAANQALSSSHTSSSSSGSDSAALAAAHSGDKGSADFAALSAQISSLHARLELLSKKQAEDASVLARNEAEKASRSNDLAALREELMNAMKSQADQFSIKLSEAVSAARSAGAGAAAAATSPASTIGSPSSHLSSPRAHGSSSGATLESLASRIDIVTARVASTETGLATTAKALVGLKNNVEALATHQVLVAASEGGVSASAAVSSSSPDSKGHGGRSTSTSSTHHASAYGVAGMDEAQFKQWAEAVTTSIATLSGVEESSGQSDSHGSSISMTRLLERATSFSTHVRPSASQSDVKNVHSVVESLEERIKVLSEANTSTGGKGAHEGISAAELERNLSAIRDLKADRADVDAKISEISSSMALLQEKVEGVLSQMAELAKMKAGSHSEANSPTHKDRGALSGKPLLRDLKCLSCDQPLAHGLPPEAGGQGPRDVMIPHLPISKSWMFSQTGGAAIMPQGLGGGGGGGSSLMQTRAPSPGQSLGGGGGGGGTGTGGGGGMSAFTMLPNGHVIQRSGTAIGSQRGSSSGVVTLPALT